MRTLATLVLLGAPSTMASAILGSASSPHYLVRRNDTESASTNFTAAGGNPSPPPRDLGFNDPLAGDGSWLTVSFGFHILGAVFTSF